MSASKGFGNVVKLRDIVDVRDPAFAGGAKGDGVTNDYAAIAAAFALAGAVAYYFPKGTYYCGTTPAITGRVGGVIYGDGIEQTIIKGPGGAANGFELKNATTRISMRDLSIDGNATTGHGMLIASTNPAVGSDTGSMLFEMVRVKNSPTVGIRIQTCSEIRFEQCELVGNSAAPGGKGLWVDGSNAVDIEWCGGGMTYWDKAIQNMADAGNSEAQISLEGNVAFGHNATADIYTNSQSRWQIDGAFTEASGRFMEVINAGSGAAGLFDIRNLCVNTIVNADKFVIKHTGVSTLMLTGCYFSAANQKISTSDNRTRVICKGNKFIDSAPFSGLIAGTYLSFDGDVVNGVTFSQHPGCKVTMSANVLIINNVSTTVGFDTEAWDYGGFHDNAVNNDRITVPAGMEGIYLVAVQVSWDANANGERQHIVTLSGTTVNINRIIPTPVIDNTEITYSFVVKALAGDYFQLSVLENSAANLNILSGTARTSLAVMRLSGAVN